MRRVNSRKAKETPCWAACGRRRSAGVRRGRITSKQGSRRSPATAGSVGGGQATERASFAAGGKARDSSSAWTTASIAFVWSPAQPPPDFRLFAGRCPTPLVGAKSALFGTPYGPGIPNYAPLRLLSKRNPLPLGFRFVIWAFLWGCLINFLKKLCRGCAPKRTHSVRLPMFAVTPFAWRYIIS